MFSSLFSTDELVGLTDDAAWLHAMLEVEVALAQAEALTGVIPSGAAGAIEDAVARLRPDAAAMGRAARASGNPVVPLVEAIRGALEEDTARWVHWGATSQDVMDTATMLVIRNATAVIGRDLRRAAGGCAALCRAHRDTVMVGRTLLQPALPTTFGLKAATWLSGLDGARRQLAKSVSGLPLQLGGAVGTLASLGPHGDAVLEVMAATLGLAVPVVPWHTERRRLAEIAGALAVASGSVAKISYDVALLMQAEIAEASEPRSPGRGGSSTLPQKRNPVSATLVGGAARRTVALTAVVHGAQPQEHERGLGGWHAEWETLTELLRLSGGAVAATADTLEGLEVDTESMAANVARVGPGLVAERFTLELARRAGRATAESLVKAALSHPGERSFLDALTEAGATTWLSRDELDALADPSTYLGSAGVFIDRALAAHERPDEL